MIQAAEQALAHTAVRLTSDENFKRLIVTEGPQWSLYDRALLQTVGKMLHQGLFLDETFRLIARTEERCRALLTENEVDGSLSRADASALFAELYVLIAGDGTSALPASTIYHSSRSGVSRGSGGAAVSQVLSRMAESLEGRSPGELVLFCEMIRLAAPPELLAVVPRLLRNCWRTGIYHLRLEALQMAQWNASNLSGKVREEVESFIGTLQTSDIFLNTSIVDTLGAFGMLEPPVAADEVARDLAAILGGSEDPDLQKWAYRTVSNIFEDVYQGVFWDAISELHHEDRLRLLTMAALGAPSYGFSTDWILGELLEHADVRALPAFLRWATTIDAGRVSDQDAMARYVLGMKGCSRYLDQPPAPIPLETDAEKAWHACGALIFWLYKPSLSVAERRSAAAQWWERLQSKWPREAARMLLQLRRPDHYKSGRERRATLDELYTVFPDEVRQVLEFGLVNRADLGWRRFEENEELAALIRWLGVVGNRRTVRLLGELVNSPELGPDAVEALRKLNEHHFGA